MAMIPLRPFGLDVDGFDMAAARGSDLVYLRGALADHGVVILRGQTGRDTQFVKFLSRLGPVRLASGETPVEGHPMLSLITGETQKGRDHTDFRSLGSEMRQPPAFGALRALQLPGGAGETLFTDQYQAFGNLTGDVVARLRLATLHHGRVPGEGEDRDGDVGTGARHPLFCRHPLSGRITLYVSSPKRCGALSGLTQNADTRMLGRLYALSTHWASLYRHVWRPGDVVIWDNRCTMVRPDHLATTHAFEFHGASVAGDAPIPAFP